MNNFPCRVITLPNGTPVHVVPPVTVKKNFKRSWRERLFSRPWRPWVSSEFREETWEVLEPKKIIHADGKVFMSQTTFNLVRRELVTLRQPGGHS